jgi:hypothetical protein
MAADGPWPAIVAHADWSTDPRKRWVARAVRRGDGRYLAHAPEPVGPLEALFDRLRRDAPPDGSLFLGFDFPIGLPRTYAQRAAIADFRAVLPSLGDGPWTDMFRVAEAAGEIALGRPFYPARAARRGTVSRRHLIEGLGLDGPGDLLRACDHGHGARGPACPLFWTLGPQQVGKAAIVGWRDLLIPGLAAGHDLAIWPFDGDLATLLSRRAIVVAETYPAELYAHLGLRASGTALGKRQRAVRAAQAPRLLERLGSLGATPSVPLRQALADGFGALPDGEDPFDATVGMIGMLNVVRGHRGAVVPEDPVVRAVEGWILGQAAPVAQPSAPTTGALP